MEAPRDYVSLEEQLGYKFFDRSHLERALTHSSFVNENPALGRTDNERLEFLGDAVLGLVITDMLIERFEEMDEGGLTEARKQMVDEQSLAGVATRLDLGKYVFVGQGEAQAGGRNRRRLLADTFEAVVGAMFKDGGPECVFPAVRLLFDQQMRLPEKSPKARLQEHAQARHIAPPEYAIVDKQGPSNAPHFEVDVSLGGKLLGRGAGASIKAAEQGAAEAALASLRSRSEADL